MADPVTVQAHESPWHEPEAPELLVLRHGESEHNLNGIWQGQADPPLTDRGREQARAAAAVLASLRPTSVVASDLQRAGETGEIVAAAAGVPVRYDSRLREIHVGQWSGRTREEVQAQFPEDHERMLRGEDFARGVDGESVGDVAVRVLALAQEVIAQAGPGERVVLATHGVAGRALVAGLLGIDQMVAWRVLGGLGNCHWARLSAGRAGWRLASWNVGP